MHFKVSGPLCLLSLKLSQDRNTVPWLTNALTECFSGHQGKIEENAICMARVHKNGRLE